MNKFVEKITKSDVRIHFRFEGEIFKHNFKVHGKIKSFENLIIIVKDSIGLKRIKSFGGTGNEPVDWILIVYRL